MSLASDLADLKAFAGRMTAAMRGLDQVPRMRWATVGGTSPLTVTLDGDSAPCAVDWAPPVLVGARVLVQVQGHNRWVIGGPGWVASLSPQGANVQETVRKLHDTVTDVAILTLGDSTAAQSGQMMDVLLPSIQALYPHRTLMRAGWNDTTKAYGALAQVGPSGTGSYHINWYQGAISGTVPESIEGAQFDAQVSAVQPDLVIVHYGINYGYDAASSGASSNAAMDRDFFERMSRFVLMLRESCPSADIMLNSQNPYLVAGARADLSSVRAQAVRDLAAKYGTAYGPVVEAFIATGNPAAYLQADLTHPTTSGATNGALLGASALLPQLAYAANLEATSRIPSPLTTSARQLVTNGTFASFASPPTLPGWTASNATLAKDTTNYESPQGYALKITGTAAAYSQAYQSLPIQAVRGRIVTVAARVYVPPGSGSECGRVAISGGGGTVTDSSATRTNLQGVFSWVFATTRIPAAAAYATVSMHGGTAVGENATYDRISVVVGDLPRDTA